MNVIHWLCRSASVTTAPPLRKWSFTQSSSLLNTNARSASTSSSLMADDPLSTFTVISPCDSSVSAMLVRCATSSLCALPQELSISCDEV